MIVVDDADGADAGGGKIHHKRRAKTARANEKEARKVLVEQIGGEFGTGAGEEYLNANPDDPDEGIYIPIWMPVEELPLHKKIYPEEVVDLVLHSVTEGWPEPSEAPTLKQE